MVVRTGEYGQIELAIFASHSVGSGRKHVDVAERSSESNILLLKNLDFLVLDEVPIGILILLKEEFTSNDPAKLHLQYYCLVRYDKKKTVI